MDPQVLPARLQPVSRYGSERLAGSNANKPDFVTDGPDASEFLQHPAFAEVGNLPLDVLAGYAQERRNITLGERDGDLATLVALLERMGFSEVDEDHGHQAGAYAWPSL